MTEFWKGVVWTLGVELGTLLFFCIVGMVCVYLENDGNPKGERN